MERKFRVRTKIIPVIEANCWEFRGCFRYENFSRNFGLNRMAIPAAAEFLFCRFQQLSEIRYFLSNRQSEGPLSRCFSLFLFTSGNLTPSGTPTGPPTGTHTRYAYDSPVR